MATTRSKKTTAKTSTVVLVNPSTAALTYTEDGKLLGAGEAIEVPALDAAGQHAVDAGYLVIREQDAPAPSASETTGGTGDSSESTDTPARRSDPDPA